MSIVDCLLASHYHNAILILVVRPGEGVIHSELLDVASRLADKEAMIVSLANNLQLLLVDQGRDFLSLGHKITI